MMKMLSKIRNASSARNSSATMIAAFIAGSVTLRSRSQNVAPSTSAASCSSPGTWASPARRSSDMNGVVFQISEVMIAISADQWWPNQSKSALNQPKVSGAATY